jgi:AcrR family transcriptional regulator
MQSKQQRRTDTRERILDVSAKLFAEKGYSATGIDEIARNVGITKSVIYYNFKNKKAILQTLIEEAFAQIQQPEIHEAHKHFHETGEHSRELMGLIQFLGTERNRQIIKIIFMESMKDKTASVPLFEIWDQSLALHRNFGEDHQQLEKWLNDDPRRKVEVFFIFLLPLLTFFIFRDRWCDRYKLSPEEAWDALSTGLMDYFYPKLF